MKSILWLFTLLLSLTFDITTVHAIENVDELKVRLTELETETELVKNELHEAIYAQYKKMLPNASSIFMSNTLDFEEVNIAYGDKYFNFNIIEIGVLVDESGNLGGYIVADTENISNEMKAPYQNGSVISVHWEDEFARDYVSTDEIFFTMDSDPKMEILEIADLPRQMTNFKSYVVKFFDIDHPDKNYYLTDGHFDGLKREPLLIYGD